MIRRDIQKAVKKYQNKTLARFLLVGCCNTLISGTVMFLLYNLAGCSYWLSSMANYITGSIVSFFLNKYFTFRNHEHSWKQVVRFAANVVVCYLLAYGLAKPLTIQILAGQPTNIQENVAMLVGMCIYTALNYFGQRFFIFTPSD